MHILKWLVSKRLGHLWRLVAISLFTCLFQSHAVAIESTRQWQGEGPHIKVALLSEVDALVPGQAHMLAIRMQPDEQWHTYWRNPGDSGEAPQIQWAESAGLRFGDILWPTPESIPVAHLLNYGYSDTHLLMVPVFVDKGLISEASREAAITIQADLTWLVCKEDCIPGDASLTLTLPIRESAAKSEFGDEFTQARKQLPKEDFSQGSFEINEQSIAIEFDSLNTSGNSSQWEVFPFRNDLINHAGAQPQVNNDGKVSVLLERSAYFNAKRFLATNEPLEFLIKSNADSGGKAFYLSANASSLDIASASGFASSDNELSSDAESMPLLTILLFAFLGGLILNVMPCVLPILSIKALALNQTHTGFWHKNAYLLGVIVCFNAFALTIVALQQGGQELGWGFHMQSPIVIWLLAFLFTFIALVLLDVFTFGSKMAGLGNGLVSGDDPKSHFFTGLLAVIVASPCTAPFMAAALGVALVSEPTTTLLIFNALAIGFALPLTLLFVSNNLRKFLPKPGNWMVTFKHFLAFPMFATVAWLCWVYAGQQGAIAQFVLLVALIAFSFFAWAMAKVSAKVSWALGVAMLASLALPFTSPLLGSSTATTNTALKSESSLTNNSAIDSALAFEDSELAAKREQGQVVLVNMTADWCITCKVNEHVALNTDAVKIALEDPLITYMVGDWTNKNDEILKYLKQYQRAGVPLYVVYAGTKPANVLPQILTPGLVVDALNQAKQELSYVSIDVSK
ncbi:protein-disulfide reductase DsbD family protein [Ningiella sp. W23]|uniref:protein-disulfide reductase DsbD family protein n=1 Tax=Ningiella sp. W23 TaxID=3023715 RepID=UPI003756BA62